MQLFGNSDFFLYFRCVLRTTINDLDVLGLVQTGTLFTLLAGLHHDGDGACLQDTNTQKVNLFCGVSELLDFF